MTTTAHPTSLSVMSVSRSVRVGGPNVHMIIVKYNAVAHCLRWTTTWGKVLLSKRRMRGVPSERNGESEPWGSGRLLCEFNIDAKRTAFETTWTQPCDSNRKKKRNEQSQLFIITCLVLSLTFGLVHTLLFPVLVVHYRYWYHSYPLVSYLGRGLK